MGLKFRVHAGMRHIAARPARLIKGSGARVQRFRFREYGLGMRV